MADIQVNQVPTNITFECDQCENENTIPYHRFIQEYGRECDWEYKKIKCPACGFENIVDSWYFD